MSRMMRMFTLAVGLRLICVGDFAMADDVFEASIDELQAQMSSGALTAEDLVRYYLVRIDAYDDRLNAVMVVNPKAVQEARALDVERRRRGARGPLHGIPVIVKDNYETTGMATTAGSASLKGFAPDRDAFQVAKLKSAGAIILGKATMHEFAYGITTVGSGFGETRNPYDLTRTPGGSSGGTGAAVAANFATFGMGSDTCGSIRIPAAHNNLVGLRGTQGLSSRTGIIPLSHTQDIGGPLAKSIKDLAYALDATVGYDPADPQSAESIGQIRGPYAEQLDAYRLDGRRIGLIETSLTDASAEVQTLIRAAAKELEALGVEVPSVTFDHKRLLTERPTDGFLVLSYDFRGDINRYFAANPIIGFESLAAFIETGEYHPQIKPMLEGSEYSGTEMEPAYYRELANRQHVRQTLLTLLVDNQLDALLYPTLREIPALVGEIQDDNNCMLSAVSGLPALAIPAGFTETGIPIGMELLGPMWSEPKLLGLGHRIEQARPQRRAPDSVPPL